MESGVSFKGVRWRKVPPARGEIESGVICEKVR
jgi:hypothetical protein